MAEATGVGRSSKPVKRWKLKLSLEVKNRGDVTIVHCEGRIVYRDEAGALSQLVGEMLDHGEKLCSILAE